MADDARTGREVFFMNEIEHHTNIEAERERIRTILSGVMDPEIPVLSVIDLGILRDIEYNPPTEKDQKEGWTIIITPTYTGCPAMDVISMNIRIAMISYGLENVRVKQVLSPAWTTDWMTEEGKEKLKAFGIAPPNPSQQVCHTELFSADEAVQCPRCNSYQTHRISEFGSTACKSLFQCDECREAFDYFKCH